MNSKLYLVFSILFCIATLFMGVGYASINSVSLNVSGEMTAQVQDGIFITEVNYNEELSNNVLASDSKINSSYQTNLDSSITLSNDKDSRITYDITIYNSNDLAYVFDGIEYALGEDTYSNENIIYKLFDLNIGDIINSKDGITFSITFYYNDSENISDVKLKSLLNFKFVIKPYVVLNASYTGECEKFVAHLDGIYKVELWGASGGHSRCNGVSQCGNLGLGAYTSGEIELHKGTEFIVCVGGKGADAQPLVDSKGGFNGGGDGLSDGSEGEAASGGDEGSGGGGGATDIRIINGSVVGFAGLKSRIMVAGGGAGATWYNEHLFHAAGGLTTDMYKRTFIYGSGKDGDITVTVSTPNTTQTSGYKFGIGAKGVGMGYSDGSPGGGGGYYGGNEHHDENNIYDNLSAGGSSFISGHSGCDAIKEESIEANIIHTGQSVHYSGYKFSNTIMVDGEGYNWTTSKGEKTGMPTHDGTGSMIGNSGDGYAKITFVKEQ